MCTVTWLRRQGGGFDLFSNRDERRTRPLASPPQRLRRAGTTLVAPLDGEAGGSWIGVNEHGLAATLLNLYELEGAYDPPEKPVSRGLLLLEQLAAAGAAQVAEGLVAGTLAAFRPFVLLALGEEGPALVASWNGDRLEIAEGGDSGLLSSSGHDAAAAEAARRTLLAELAAARGGLSPALLLDFHRSHRPQRGALSPCMHREEARTVSFSHVRVERGEVSLAYAPGPPCRTPVGAARRLPRRRPGR